MYIYIIVISGVSISRAHKNTIYILYVDYLQKNTSHTHTQEIGYVHRDPEFRARLS